MEESRNNGRRKFLCKSAAGLSCMLIGSGLTGFGSVPLKSVTILHTNDVHSHIDPFDSNHPKFAGRGGVSHRSALIREIRKTNRNVLLFDAGDMFQGTPYFNMFGGVPELKLMNLMGYNAATIGNHDFDNGIEALSEVLKLADFPLINANYDFTGTPMEGKCQPYRIFEMDGIRIGVIGLGIQLEGLVSGKLTGKTAYLDPVNVANKWSAYLKSKKRCNLVVCLSHLGYQYQDEKISDIKLAENCKDLDLIIGGHTHTFIDEPLKITHRDGTEILVTQAGWAGLRLGRIDYHFHAASNEPKRVLTSMKDF